MAWISKMKDTAANSGVASRLVVANSQANLDEGVVSNDTFKVSMKQNYPDTSGGPGGDGGTRVYGYVSG